MGGQKKGKKRGPKRNGHQKAADLLKASEMRKEGIVLREIGDALDLSHEQVRQDLAELDKISLLRAEKNIEEIRKHCEASLYLSQVEALKAWKRSLENAETITETEDEDGFSRKYVTKGQSGNPTHIGNFIKAAEGLAKLYGLYETSTGGDDSSDMLGEIYEQIKEAREEQNRGDGK